MYHGLYFCVTVVSSSAETSFVTPCLWSFQIIASYTSNAPRHSLCSSRVRIRFFSVDTWVNLRLSYREFPPKEIYLREYTRASFLAREVWVSSPPTEDSKCIFRSSTCFPLARSSRNSAAYDGCEPMDQCVSLVACRVGGSAKRNRKIVFPWFRYTSMLV